MNKGRFNPTKRPLYFKKNYLFTLLIKLKPDSCINEKVSA